ncbi:MAG: hypothetical protein RIM84_18570 [Alphaproteobacteria bacterium]
MIAYPVRVPRKAYRGSKPQIRRKVAERNAVAARLEQHINADFSASGASMREYLYELIALELYLPVDIVRDILCRLKAGHNGVTVFRRTSPVS